MNGKTAWLRRLRRAGDGVGLGRGAAGRRRQGRNAGRHWFRPVFALLEDRRLLSTFAVNTTADENDANAVPGDLSLREAIIQANATPGPNTIVVPAGTYKLTIPGSGETAGQTGDLNITNSVTIQGAGAGSTIIDGNGLDRVFDILGKGSSTTVVGISGVTIQGGRAPDGLARTLDSNSGGGVEAYNASLTVDQCVIQDNRTGNGSVPSSSGGLGGGIDIKLGTVTVTNSTITGTALAPARWSAVLAAASRAAAARSPSAIARSATTRRAMAPMECGPARAAGSTATGDTGPRT